MRRGAHKGLSGALVWQVDGSSDEGEAGLAMEEGSVADSDAEEHEFEEAALTSRTDFAGDL